jgi:hypothetical protein
MNLPTLHPRSLNSPLILSKNPGSGAGWRRGNCAGGVLLQPQRKKPMNTNRHLRVAQNATRSFELNIFRIIWIRPF